MPIQFQELKNIVEAAILTSEVPVSAKQIASLFPVDDAPKVFWKLNGLFSTFKAIATIAESNLKKLVTATAFNLVRNTPIGC